MSAVRCCLAARMRGMRSRANWVRAQFEDETLLKGKKTQLVSSQYFGLLGHTLNNRKHNATFEGRFQIFGTHTRRD